MRLDRTPGKTSPAQGSRADTPSTARVPEYSIKGSAAPTIGAAPLAKQSLTQQFPGEFVDVALVSGSPAPDRDDEDGDLSSLDAVDDPVPLADSADAAGARELADERLALLLGRPGELIGALNDETSDALVGDRLDELERGLSPRDRERAIRAHRPRRFLASI